MDTIFLFANISISVPISTTRLVNLQVDSMKIASDSFLIFSYYDRLLYNL